MSKWGSRLWQASADVARAIRTPVEESGRTIAEDVLDVMVKPALADASDIDKSFLLAMAKDDGPSRMKDIQQRLEIDANFASQYQDPGNRRTIGRQA